MESNRNKEGHNQENPLLQFSTQVGRGHPHAEPQPSSAPVSTKASTPTQEKAADSKLHNAPPNIDHWWGWDILGLVLALAILIAIIVILRVYDGKQQPSWRWISLNTLLSWLSTVGKGCIAFPISAGLSQLKWVWFAQRKRPLSDLRVFDGASRGIYGSAELLWALRMRHFAVLGAIAMLLAVGFDPFIQNLVNYSPDLVVDASRISRLANTTDYSGLGPLQAAAENFYIEPTFKGNIYNSIFSTDIRRPWAIPQYMCPTGNCTWDPIASLAVRALCSDVTSSIKKTCEHIDSPDAPYDNCTVSLPNGASAYYAGGYKAAAIALQVQPSSQPVVYINATLPVYSASKQYVATECSLEPVVRSVRAYVNSSVYNETTLAEWPKAEAWKDKTKSNYGYSLLPDWNSSLGIQPGQNFTLFPSSHSTISLFMESLFSGKAQTDMMQLAFVPTRNQYGFSYAVADVIQAFMYGNVTGCADIENDRFVCAMRNVADAMSKSFRDQAYIDNEQGANMVLGHTQVNVIIVHVHWQWLTLPLLVWLLGAVTWLGTEWKTHRGKLQKWSDNPLPLLFLYRDGEDSRSDKVQGLSNKAYERRAKSIHAQLYTKENQAALAE